MKAEFEEKEYEFAANWELTAGQVNCRVYPAGQVLESIVGYDAAAGIAARHRLWGLLRVPVPRGARLLPHHWGPGREPKAERIPPEAVNVILQYKRPDHVLGGRGAQWSKWGAPYYRFQITDRQHEILLRLEAALGASAIVRYSAPAFATIAELNTHRWSSDVLAQSGFTSPSSIGSGHVWWTYQAPGAIGKPNPSGPSGAFDSLDGLVNAISDASHAKSQLITGYRDWPALLDLAGASEPLLDDWRRGAVRDWTSAVRSRADVDLSRDQMERIWAYATVQTLMEQAGSCWQLMAPQRG